MHAQLTELCFSHSNSCGVASMNGLCVHLREIQQWRDARTGELFPQGILAGVLCSCARSYGDCLAAVQGL